MHPGQILLKCFLEPEEISHKEFKKHLGWERSSRLSQIINGHSAITAKSALLIGNALGNSPESWLKLQLQWDLWEAAQDHKKIKVIRKSFAKRPTKMTLKRKSDDMPQGYHQIKKVEKQD